MKYEYDTLNRLNKVITAKLEATTYSYNLAGKLITTTFPDTKTLLKQYDELGRLIKTTDANGKIQKHYYDANNNATKLIDRMSQTFTYTYSNRNFLMSKVAPAPDETISFTYNDAGKRKSMSDITGLTAYDYKPTTGELEKITTPDLKTIQYQYDNQGNRSQMTDPFGASLNYTYNNLNQLTDVGAAPNPNLGGYEAHYDYYKNGLIKESKRKNGIATSFTYDGARLQNMIHKKADGTIFNSFDYTYDLNNNIKKKVEISASVNTTINATYDPLNRIETSDQLNKTYTYDNRGNRQLYNNNVMQDSPDAEYGYDKRDRLTSVITQGKTISYKYNGDGMLYERTENGATIRYYYDGANVIAEATVVGGVATMKARYIRGNGLIARQDASANKAYYLQNGHGDIVELHDSTGATSLNQYTYDMWGNPLTTTETVENPFRYSGELWDKSTSLQYLRARWYDPSVGRFINEDTYEGQIDNPLSLNRYSYVHNNPLIGIDPTGHCPMCILPIVAPTATAAAWTSIGVAFTGIAVSLGMDKAFKSAAPSNPPKVNVPTKRILQVYDGGKSNFPSPTNEKKPISIPFYNPDDDKDKGNRQIVYRALNEQDVLTSSYGMGIHSKKESGDWDIVTHVLRGSQPEAWIHDPWISATTDLSIALEFDSSSNRGIVAIDLSKVLNPYVYNASSINPSKNPAAFVVANGESEIAVYNWINGSAILGRMK